MMDRHLGNRRRSAFFREKRMALEKLPMIRPPRGGQSSTRSLIRRFWRNSEGESRFQKRGYKILSKAQTRAARQELVAQFPNHIIDVLHYRGIDQGQEGACSLVALIHVILLSDDVNDVSSSSFLLNIPPCPTASRGGGGKRKRNRKRTPASIMHRSWKKYWNPAYIHGSARSPSSSTSSSGHLKGILYHR